MTTIVAGVVTFNPDPGTLKSLLSLLLDEFNEVALFDNSERPSTQLQIGCLCDSHGVDYRRGTSNVGTAGGINDLLEWAHERGAAFLAYFDQDSVPGMEYRLRAETYLANEHDNALAPSPTTAVLCPVVVGAREEPPAAHVPPFHASEVPLCITSGMIMNVQFARKIGGFDENLFLDLVDHEYCLRVRLGGGQILRLDSMLLTHSLGTGYRRICGVGVTRHPYWRRVLMWRNLVLVSRRYYASFPVQVAKLVVGRALDSALASLAFRQVYYLTSAPKGVRMALFAPDTRPHPETAP